MKVLSWNVNGIRAIANKGFLAWLEKESPDIFCAQETKASPEQVPDAIRNPRGYHTYWSAGLKKGYSGVALFAKKKPLKVSEGIGVAQFDSEGRVLWAEYGGCVICTVYVPNGGSGNIRVPFKMAFYDAFLRKLERMRKAGKKVIICGDINTAHTEIDLARPKQNEKNTGFLPEERAWLTAFLSRGYIDTFRHLTPEPGHYTWWDYKTGARSRNVGWRIDYFFITPNLCGELKRAFILRDVTGSDHCPIGIELKNGLL